jgi:hypothetical protein
MHRRWSRPGMDAAGFGPEVTGVAVFVAGTGNPGRSLTALPGTGAPWRVAGARPVPVGPGPALHRQSPTPDLLPTITPR